MILMYRFRDFCSWPLGCVPSGSVEHHEQGELLSSLELRNRVKEVKERHSESVQGPSIPLKDMHLPMTYFWAMK